MDVPAQISLSIVRSAGFPPIIPFMLSSQRMLEQYSLFLSGDHSDFISFANIWINQMYLVHTRRSPERKREYRDGIRFRENLTGRITGMSAHLTKLGLLWACPSITCSLAC